MVREGESHDAEGGESNYTSLIEFQALEATAKNAHIECIHELREFWSGIRADAGSISLHNRVKRIGALATTANTAYVKLTQRFPNARNVFLLYSRFCYAVTADSDTAQAMRNIADDLEQDNQEIDGQLQNGGKAGEDEMEKKSAAHSRGSSQASKEAKLLKKKRQLLNERMNDPMRKLVSRGIWIILSFVAIIVVATVTSEQSLVNTAHSLDKLEKSMYGRRMMHVIYSEVRHFEAEAEHGTYEEYKKYNEDLKHALEEWHSVAEVDFKDLVTSTETDTSTTSPTRMAWSVE